MWQNTLKLRICSFTTCTNCTRCLQALLLRCKAWIPRTPWLCWVGGGCTPCAAAGIPLCRFDLSGFIITEATAWRNWRSTSLCSTSIMTSKMPGRCCWANWLLSEGLPQSSSTLSMIWSLVTSIEHQDCHVLQKWLLLGLLCFGVVLV